MQLIFTRHGETDWNTAKKIQGSNDIPLNERGIAQARSMGEKLVREQYPIQRIYTSRQLRAKKTAEIAAEFLGVECRIVDGLEEMNLGLWEGLSWKQVEEQFPEEYAVWKKSRRYTRSPKGECYQDVLDRLLPVLRQIIEAEKGGKDILIVTHSAVVVCLLAYLHGTPFHEMVAAYPVQNTQLIAVDSEEILRAIDGIRFKRR